MTSRIDSKALSNAVATANHDFFLNRVKTVPLSCSLHGHRVRMRTCFFSRHLVGTAVQLLQSFALHRCLIGDFSLETSQSKLLRQRLVAIFQAWRAPFASCIAEAQTIGEIDSTFDPMDLAEFLLSSWEGAILRMKVDRGPAALDRFKNIIFQTIFKESKNEDSL